MSRAPTALSGIDHSPTLERIRSAGCLRVGTTGDYRPFTFRNPDGSYEGADIAMAASFARELGVEALFVKTSWAGLLGDFMSGAFDLAVGGISIDPRRREHGLFSTTVLTDGKRPIVRLVDRERFITVADIDRPDVRVIVNPGASNEAFARRELGRSTLILHPDNVTIFDEIVAGRADVMVTDGIEVEHQARLHPELCAAAVSAPFTRLEKAYLLPKDAAFKAVVDQWLERQLAAGTYARALATTA